MGTNITNINIGGTQIIGGNSSSVPSFLPTQLPPEVVAPNSVIGNFLEGFDSGFTQGFLDGFKGSLNGQTTPVEPPNPVDSSHPAGSLTVDKATGDITTAGGFKISQVGQFDWKITGPDGKASEIWGDPHVKELDASGKEIGKFDFKKPSTFVLADGTRIDVAVKPYGANGNVTVTSGLTVTSGNDRVQVTGIDQGKGKVGDVTQDGFQHVNDAGGNQVFVEGKDASQWTQGGKEILGNDGAPDQFKLGNDVPPLLQGPGGQTGGTQGGGNKDWASQLMQDISNLLKDLMPLMSDMMPFLGSNPYLPGNPDRGTFNNGGHIPVDNGVGGTPTNHGIDPRFEGGPVYQRDNHLAGLGDAFKVIGDMFKLLGDISSLTDQVNRRPINI